MPSLCATALSSQIGANWIGQKIVFALQLFDLHGPSVTKYEEITENEIIIKKQKNYHK
jgi:hypothetical protein